MLALSIGVASGAKLKTESASTTIEPEEVGSATATCPRGTKAISGGFSGEAAEPPPDPVDVLLTTYESRREGGRKWTAGAMNQYDTSEAGESTAFAYCRDEKVKRKSAETTIPSGGGPTETATLIVKCPRGTKVVSGGFANPDFGYNLNVGPGIFPYVSKKSGKRSWRVSAANIGNDDGTFEAFAYCREGKGLKTSSASVVNDHPDVFTATAECQRGQRVLSGGFAYANPPTDDPSEGPFVVESRKQGKRSWVVSGFDNAFTTNLVAYAYCEKT